MSNAAYHRKHFRVWNGRNNTCLIWCDVCSNRKDAEASCKRAALSSAKRNPNKFVGYLVRKNPKGARWTMALWAIDKPLAI